MPASLSIVIPSHNRPDLLRHCLASVVRHAPARAEVVIVDDGSKDGLVSRTAKDFGRVQVVRMPRRSGFCAAANAGIHAASNPIIEMLNDDTVVTAGWAAAALKWFDDPSVAAVAPLVLCWRAGGVPPLRTARRFGQVVDQGANAPRSPQSSSAWIIDSAGDRYHVGGVAGKRGHGQRLEPAYLKSRRVFGASASSAFYRKDVLLQVGAFPEEFGAYFEDVDLAFRLNRAGYRAVFEPACCVLHRVGSSHAPSRQTLEQQSRNEELVFWRNVPKRALPWALPLHLAVLGGKALLRWDDGGLAPFISGRLRVLGELPRLLQHRRQLRELGSDADLQYWNVETGWLPSLDPYSATC